MPNVRCTVHYPGPGTATLSGLRLDHLRDILAGARRHFVTLRVTAQAPLLSGETERTRGALAYADQTLKVLEQVQQALDAGIAATFPPRPPEPKTKADRWAEVRDSARQRGWLAAVLSGRYD